MSITVALASSLLSVVYIHGNLTLRSLHGPFYLFNVSPCVAERMPLVIFHSKLKTRQSCFLFCDGSKTTQKNGQALPLPQCLPVVSRRVSLSYPKEQHSLEHSPRAIAFITLIHSCWRYPAIPNFTKKNILEREFTRNSF